MIPGCRRTSSDSALYQKLNNPSNNQKSASEQGSPEFCGAGGLETDVKPPAELLQSLMREQPGDQLQPVKEEPRLVSMAGGAALVTTLPGYTKPTQAGGNILLKIRGKVGDQSRK